MGGGNDPDAYRFYRQWHMNFTDKETLMPRSSQLFVVVLAVLAAVLAVRPAPAAAAPSPITFNLAVTDNYKAMYNVPLGTIPTVRENRSWFQLKSLTVAGVTYRPASLPPAGTNPVFAADEAVTGSDQSSAVVSVRTDSPIVSGRWLRTDANGDWGPRIDLVDANLLQANPVHVTIEVTRNGVVIGSSVVDYIWDATLWNAPYPNDEYFSPGGRWWTGCEPTRTNLESTAPPSTCTPAAADVSVSAAGSGNVSVGDDASVTLTVSNAGPAVASGVVLSDLLPAGLRLESFVPGPGVTCTGALTCSLASLAVGAQAQVRLIVAPVVGGGGTIVHSVSVSAQTTDPASGNNSLSQSMASWGFDCTVIGTAGPDLLTGTTARDVLCGLGGNDTLSGSDGNDQLYGGDGNDTLSGDAGDDVLAGGPDDDAIHGGANSLGGFDRLSFADAQSSMVVNMGQLHSWDDLNVPGDARVGFDAFDGVEAAIGSAFDDTMLGGAGDDKLEGVGGNDKLYGYGGNDILDGGVGDDLLNGGDGTGDLASYAASGSAVTVDLALTVQQNTLGQGLDTISNVENVTGSNSADTLSGNALPNVLNGGLGNDILSGRDGADTLHGNEGDDRLYGGNGDDLLYGETGNDLLDGQLNLDTCNGGGQLTDSKTNCER